MCYPETRTPFHKKWGRCLDQGSDRAGPAEQSEPSHSLVWILCTWKDSEPWNRRGQPLSPRHGVICRKVLLIPWGFCTKWCRRPLWKPAIPFTTSTKPSRLVYRPPTSWRKAIFLFKATHAFALVYFETVQWVTKSKDSHRQGIKETQEMWV